METGNDFDTFLADSPNEKSGEQIVFEQKILLS